MKDYSINLPGRIVSFDVTDQTASVQICAERISSDSAANGTSNKPTILEGVPVHVLSGGGWHITMPIKAGNTCVLFFSQVGYDHWFYEDKDTAGLLAGLPKPWLNRKFSDDDGYALVGFNTIPRKIASYSDVNSEWRNADASQIIRLKGDSSIEIESTVRVKVIAPILEIVSPVITMSGSLAVVGAITSDTSVVAPTGTFGGISSEGHTHMSNGNGNQTDGPS